MNEKISPRTSVLHDNVQCMEKYSSASYPLRGCLATPPKKLGDDYTVRSADDADKTPHQPSMSLYILSTARMIAVIPSAPAPHDCVSEASVWSLGVGGGEF